MQQTECINLEQITGVLAEFAIALISNGANSARTKRNLNRIATAFDYKIEQFFSHSAIILTVEEPKTNRKKTIVKSIAHYHVNYSIISEISILTWEVADGKIPFSKLEEELKEITEMKSYPEWAKFVFIGLATAGLSKIFDATHPEFFIAFVAAISGMFVRKIILEKKYNIYISWLIAAFVSTSVVNICRTLGLQDFHGALTACVLWLIPGVPLINGVLDILENHIVSGWAKVAMGFMMVFMIAVGFYLSLFLFGYGNTI